MSNRTVQFLTRNATRKRGMLRRPMSIRPSVTFEYPDGWHIYLASFQAR